MADDLPIVEIDADGYWWRDFNDPTSPLDVNVRSMVPTNADNSPIPQPVKRYRLVEVDDQPLDLSPAAVNKIVDSPHLSLRQKESAISEWLFAKLAETNDD
jgi:hypothetical protein